MRGRLPAAGALGGAVVAAAGLLGLLLGDGPYLQLDSLSPWVLLWAVGLFALLMLAPFALHRRLTDGDPANRWEMAIVAWGGVALAAGIGFGLLAAIRGFGTATGLGALAVVGLFECALIAASVLMLILTTG